MSNAKHKLAGPDFSTERSALYCRLATCSEEDIRIEQQVLRSRGMIAQDIRGLFFNVADRFMLDRREADALLILQTFPLQEWNVTALSIAVGIAMNEHRYEEALDLIDHPATTKIHEGNIHVTGHRYLILLQLGRREEAALEAALLMQKGFRNMKVMTGITRKILRAGFRMEADALWKELNEHFAEQDTIHRYYAWYLFECGDFEAMLREWRIFLKALPEESSRQALLKCARTLRESNHEDIANALESIGTQPAEHVEEATQTVPSIRERYLSDRRTLESMIDARDCAAIPAFIASLIGDTEKQRDCYFEIIRNAPEILYTKGATHEAIICCRHMMEMPNAQPAGMLTSGRRFIELLRKSGKHAEGELLNVVLQKAYGTEVTAFVEHKQLPRGSKAEKAYGLMQSGDLAGALAVWMPLQRSKFHACLTCVDQLLEQGGCSALTDELLHEIRLRDPEVLVDHIRSLVDVKKKPYKNVQPYLAEILPEPDCVALTPAHHHALSISAYCASIYGGLAFHEFTTFLKVLCHKSLLEAYEYDEYVKLGKCVALQTERGDTLDESIDLQCVRAKGIIRFIDRRPLRPKKKKT